MNRTQGFGSPSTIGILQGRIRSLYNDLWGTHPQLNRGLSNLPRSFTTRSLYDTTNRLGYTMHPRGTSSWEHNAPKSNKLLNVNPTNLRGESKPMQLMQWQEHTKWSNPSLQNPTKATNVMEGFKRKNKRRNTKNSKI